MNVDDAGAAPRRPLSRSAGSYGYPFWLDDLVTDSPRFDSALCAEIDPELFFPEKGQRSDIPRSLCARCPEQIPCLDYALSQPHLYGVWGGTTERMRIRIRTAEAAGEVA